MWLGQSSRDDGLFKRILSQNIMPAPWHCSDSPVGSLNAYPLCLLLAEKVMCTSGEEMDTNNNQQTKWKANLYLPTLQEAAFELIIRRLLAIQQRKKELLCLVIAAVLWRWG